MGIQMTGSSRRQVLGLAAGLGGAALVQVTGLAYAQEAKPGGGTDDKVEPPNAARVRRLYEVVASKDAERLSGLLAADVVFHIPGRGTVAGEYKGKDAIMRLFRTVVQETRGTFKTELLEVLANAQYAVTKHRWSAERNGRQVKMDNFCVYRFDKDGKLIERWEFIEDLPAHDTFWS